MKLSPIVLVALAALATTASGSDLPRLGGRRLDHTQYAYAYGYGTEWNVPNCFDVSGAPSSGEENPFVGDMLTCGV